MITKNMSIIEVLRKDTGAAPILMQYGMHCLGCPHAAMETLEDACAAHGTDVDELVARLNKYFAEKA